MFFLSFCLFCIFFLYFCIFVFVFFVFFIFFVFFVFLSFLSFLSCCLFCLFCLFVLFVFLSFLSFCLFVTTIIITWSISTTTQIFVPIRQFFNFRARAGEEDTLVLVHWWTLCFGVWTIYLCHLAKSVKEVGIRSDPIPLLGHRPKYGFFFFLNEPSLRK